MAMNKIERIDKEIAKTREKITEYQNKLRGLEAQKTEAENLQIVQLVRSMRLSPHELSAMLSGGGIPGMEAAPGYPAEPADHVGLVIGTDGERVYTVEGNSGDACKIKSYPVNYSCIKGYGLMNWN